MPAVCPAAGLFQGYGMSAVVCGPGSIEQAHKPDEFVSLDQLQHCLDMLGRPADRLEGLSGAAYANRVHRGHSVRAPRHTRRKVR